ncbi:L-seryl-tRNA(Sec) kinase [Numida meleagris]|uniref:L-seryl-tRNA(Sec) kinase n=1 Tax=Numida meleagris TaxID=8996 RepID=UPI000B3DDE61|nr:L-seryl-tRNA(Sec) kinase [Numida meleagris]
MGLFTSAVHRVTLPVPCGAARSSGPAWRRSCSFRGKEPECRQKPAGPKRVLQTASLPSSPAARYPDVVTTEYSPLPPGGWFVSSRFTATFIYFPDRTRRQDRRSARGRPRRAPALPLRLRRAAPSGKRHRDARRQRFGTGGGDGAGGRRERGAVRAVRAAGRRQVHAGPRSAPRAAAPSRLGLRGAHLRRPHPAGGLGAGRASGGGAPIDSLGFCQLFLECPLELCLHRNRLRGRPVPDGTICRMAQRMEVPEPGKNPWEQNSLVLSSSACSPGQQHDAALMEAFHVQIMSLLAAALENPVKQNKENTEQKEADRALCAASAVHRADQACRRIISQSMKEARDKNLLPSEMKSLAEELSKLKAEFLEDLRQGSHLENEAGRQNASFDPATSVLSSFQLEATDVVNKYILK